MPNPAATLSDTPRSWPIMKPTAVTRTTVKSLTISTNTTTSDPQGSAADAVDLTFVVVSAPRRPNRRRLLRFGGLRRLRGRRLRRRLGRRLRRRLGRRRLRGRLGGRLRGGLARLRRRDRRRRLRERAVVVEVDRATATGGRRLAEHLVELVLGGLLVDVQRERELRHEDLTGACEHPLLTGRQALVLLADGEVPHDLGH